MFTLLPYSCFRGNTVYRAPGELRILNWGHPDLTHAIIKSVATLENDRPGHWIARLPSNGQVIATGVNKRDVIERATSALDMSSSAFLLDAAIPVDVPLSESELQIFRDTIDNAMAQSKKNQPKKPRRW